MQRPNNELIFDISKSKTFVNRDFLLENTIFKSEFIALGVN